MGNFLRIFGEVLTMKHKNYSWLRTIIAMRDRYWAILFLDLNAPGHEGNTAIQELTGH
jgi:hypothetical protein